MSQPLSRAHDSERDDRFAALAEMASLLRGAVSSKESIASALDCLERLIPADAYALWRHDRIAGLWNIAAGRGLSERFLQESIRAKDSGRDEVLLRTPFMVDDIAQWEPVADRLSLYAGEEIRAVLVTPLHIRGEAAGTLCCYFRNPREISSEETAIAETVANILANALSTRKIDRLTEIARVLSGELDTEDLTRTVVDGAAELTGAELAAFVEMRESADGDQFILRATSGERRETIDRLDSADLRTLAQPFFDGGKVLRLADAREDERFSAVARKVNLLSYVAVPVISNDDHVLGGIFLGHSDVDVFMDAEVRVVETLAAQAAVGIDNAQLYESLQRDRAASERSELRYRSLVNATPSAQVIMVANRAGEIEDDCRSWEELTGQSPAEMKGRSWMNAIHLSDQERIAACWVRALAAGTVFNEDFRILQADGISRWFAGKAVPVRSEEGEVLEWIVMITDVHEQKTTQDGLRFLARATEILSSSLDYEATLATLARLAVPTVADWCVVDVANEEGDARPYRRVAAAHSDPAKVALARELQERYPPDPDNDQIQNVIRTGTTEFVPLMPEGLLEKAAKSEEHLAMLKDLGICSWMVIPLRARGRVLGAVTFVSSDPTRRFTQPDLHLGEEFARRAALAIDNARLFSLAQSANRAKDEFLATLSHELRTPMTAVVGWSRMLKMGLGEEESKEAIDAIEKSASVQTQLIDDILDMSRIMSGRLRIDAHPVDLRVVARAALTTVQPAAAARGVWMLTEFQANEATVAGDEGRLQQIIWNLLSNAIKFTSRGGSVVLRIATEGSTIAVTVEDSGKGIPADFLPHVFEPFRQADSSTTRTHSGIGLGLAIVKHLVELHGGRISVASEGEGRGARFVVELPLLERAPEQSTTERVTDQRTVPRSIPSLPSLDGLRVLVIDDQAYTREVVVAILQRAGGVLSAAGSVREGLERVDDFRPDIVVCDIAMPREDGYVFVAELRRHDTASETPIVALTAFGRPEDRDNALTAGFDAYLKKPVDPEDLAITVLETYQRRRRKET